MKSYGLVVFLAMAASVSASANASESPGAESLQDLDFRYLTEAPTPTAPYPAVVSTDAPQTTAPPQAIAYKELPSLAPNDDDDDDGVDPDVEQRSIEDTGAMPALPFNLDEQDH